MKFKTKINLIKQDWAYIFSLKAGKVIGLNNKCHQVPKWIALFFDIYYSGVLIGPLFLLWIAVDEYIIHDFYISVGVTLLFYFILELIVYMLIPVKHIKCWE